MNRSMWILGALIAASVIAMMYLESSGGIERPWAQCKESLVQQMFSDTCTPVTGRFGAPRTTAPDSASPDYAAPAPDASERPGEIKLK